MKRNAGVWICGLLLLTGFEMQAQADFDKTDKWLEDNVGQMGGRVILMVYKDGKIIHEHAVNEMSRRQKAVGKFIAKRQGREPDTEPYTSTTRQPMASCSKWLSAALVMSFADEGKLKMSDTVGTWLPVLSHHGKGNITIGQCLSHLTAIKSPPLKEGLEDMRTVTTMDEAIEKIAELPMEGEPGKTFHYSSVGLQIAAAVIEKISGKSFGDLFAARIAGPLDMKHTDFGPGKVPLPAGGAGSTPGDYMNFLIMVLNGGTFNGKRILSENSIAQMQVNRVTPAVKVIYSPAEAGDFGYGYGEWIMQSSSAPQPADAVTSPGLFGSFPWINKDKKYAAFLMTFYLKSEGRNERYINLKTLVDEAVD